MRAISVYPERDYAYAGCRVNHDSPVNGQDLKLLTSQVAQNFFLIRDVQAEAYLQAGC